MALIELHEEPSSKASLAELAQVFEDASGPITFADAFMKLKVFDPARQRSLQASFLQEAKEGGRFTYLIGSKVRPSITARGRMSSAFRDVPPLAPKVALIKRSDAFHGIRSIDKSGYARDLRASVEQVQELNLTGKQGDAINRMSLEYDHALELAKVKLDNAMTLAEERRRMFEEVVQVLNRVTEKELSERALTVRPTKEAAH
jgi:hypothetical protein